MICSFLCENIGECFPEKIRASCSRTIRSTSSLFVIILPFTSLIADKPPLFLSALLTKAQNCLEFTLIVKRLFNLLSAFFA